MSLGLGVTLGLGILLLGGCQTTEIGRTSAPPAEPLRAPLVLESYGQAIRVAQIAPVKDLEPQGPQFPSTRYWTGVILNRLGFTAQDFGPEEVSILDQLLFYTRPGWNIEGPFQEVYFPPPLDSPSEEGQTLQVQQYFLPQGVGSLDPSPQGVLIFVFSGGDYLTFLHFPDSPPMPASWWSVIDTEIPELVTGEAETEFRQFMTQAAPLPMESYRDPRTEFLARVIYEHEGTKDSTKTPKDLLNEVEDEEARILRFLLP